MYADFSTLKFHINEEEMNAFHRVLAVLYEMNRCMEKENRIELTLDFDDGDKCCLSTFNENILYTTLENLETILGEE